MCANLGPAAPNFDETISTLRYADRAKQIKNKPIINEDPKDTMLREMQDEISRLKAMLEARKGGGGGGVGGLGATATFDSLGNPHTHSNEGEHVMGIDAIQGDTVVEEIVEKEVIQDTGIKKEDLDQIKRLAEEEHRKLLDEYKAQNRNEEEARSMAEEATKEYEKELTRKAEILAKENAQLESMARALAEKENQLQKGGSALDAAQRKKDQLRRTEAELQARRHEQELHLAEMREAEEARVLMVEQFSSAGEELRAKTAKLKSLWGMYQEKKSLLVEVQDEFDVERQDLLETIRSLDRQIKLKNLIMEEFIPPQAAMLIEAHAAYDQTNDAWIVPGVEYAGNNVQRSEMMFAGAGVGGGGGGNGGAAAGNIGSPKRSFKRGGGSNIQHHLNAMNLNPQQLQQQQQNMHAQAMMQVNGLQAIAAPSHARFFNYAQFVQAKDEDDKPAKEKKKKKSKG